MKRLALAVVGVLALAGCTFPGAPSPNQPCPGTVRECHVVNCLVTPKHDDCPRGEVHVEICPPYCGWER